MEWTPYGGIEYAKLPGPDPYSYAIAADECTAVGGILAEPRSEDELNFIKTVLASGEAATFYPVGMKKDEDGNWVWRSDEVPVTWFKWVKNYPSNRDGRDFVWYDGRFSAMNNQGSAVYPNKAGKMATICQKTRKSFLI